MSVHYRLSDFRALAGWHPSQLHVSPQSQTSPHWHDPVGTAAPLWRTASNVEEQPQVHWVPTQVPHTQAFD